MLDSDWDKLKTVFDMFKTYSFHHKHKAFNSKLIIREFCYGRGLNARFEATLSLQEPKTTTTVLNHNII